MSFFDQVEDFYDKTGLNLTDSSPKYKLLFTSNLEYKFVHLLKIKKMKQLILISVLSLFVASVFAQSIFVEPHEKNLSSSDLWSEMVTEITVENISSSDTIDIKVSKKSCKALV